MALLAFGFGVRSIIGEWYDVTLNGQGGQGPPGFKYFAPAVDEEYNIKLVEAKGADYGPSNRYDPRLSPVANAALDRRFPEHMQLELLRGYCSAVTYMDSQLGVVLEKLETTGFAQSTVVIFFSDHGYALGERTQWGKRSLFEVSLR